MLDQTVAIKTYAGLTGEGTPTWTATAAVAARIDYGRRLLVDPVTGKQITVQATVFLNPDVAVGVGDLVTVDGLDRTVMAVDKPAGPGGAVHHLEVLAG